MLEWSIHAGWLKFSLTLLVFVLMNFARLLLVQGIIKLNWCVTALVLLVYTVAVC
jgi:hypothetical protein